MWPRSAPRWMSRSSDSRSIAAVRRARHLVGLEAVDVREGVVGHAPAKREVEYLALARVKPLEGGHELLPVDHGRSAG